MPDTLLQTPRHGQVAAWFYDRTPLKRGITIANLHTLDTARRYCDRVIGMRDGRIVFDGTPEQLTSGAARDIYGADAGFNEGATSTAISIPDADYAEAMLA